MISVPAPAVVAQLNGVEAKPPPAVVSLPSVRDAGVLATRTLTSTFAAERDLDALVSPPSVKVHTAALRSRHPVAR